MGIRYYAYAFDAKMTGMALADPLSFIGDDPLADAWGLPHDARFAATDFVQSVSKTDMLYLDKVWPSLQELSAPSSLAAKPRPAYRMFEGQVTWTDEGWIPWVRALAPEEVSEIAKDLVGLQRGLPDDAASDPNFEDVLEFLQRAVDFVTQAASANRGLVYTIG